MATSDRKAKDREYLETLGDSNVRIALERKDNLQVASMDTVWEWLKEKDDTKARRSLWTFRYTIIAAIAGIIAASASVWALLK